MDEGNKGLGISLTPAALVISASVVSVGLPFSDSVLYSCWRDSPDFLAISPTPPRASTTRRNAVRNAAMPQDGLLISPKSIGLVFRD